MKRKLSRILIDGLGWGVVCFVAFEFLGILFDRFRGISEQADVVNLLWQRYSGQLWFTGFKLAVFVVACLLAKLTMGYSRPKVDDVTRDSERQLI